MKFSVLIIISMLSLIARAEISSEVDSFGGNQALYEKAKALNPEVEKSVVQDRFINRSKRWEFSPEFASSSGGDPYNQSSSAGVNIHYHITPKWSVAVKYNYAFNELTEEGKEMFRRAEEDARNNAVTTNYLYPQVIYPKSETLGLVHWYPLVGKLSFGSWGVAHFDAYINAGYGQIELSNATTPTTTLGAGLGFWWNQNLTTRFEYRAQQYKAEYYFGTKDLSTSIASIQMGWML